MYKKIRRSKKIIHKTPASKNNIAILATNSPIFCIKGINVFYAKNVLLRPVRFLNKLTGELSQQRKRVKKG